MKLNQGEVGKWTVPNAGEGDVEGVEEVKEVLYSAVLSPFGRSPASRERVIGPEFTLATGYTTCIRKMENSSFPGFQNG
jgi:hypothetical protein